MKKKAVFLAAVSILSMLADRSTSHAKIWTVDVGGFSFTPANLTINQGDTVKWQWQNGSHTTTSGTQCTPDGIWNQSINSANPTYLRQFVQAGMFPYYCIPHCNFGMTGSIHVMLFSGILDDSSTNASIPSAGLDQNYPNPFNAATEISFRLSDYHMIRLDIYDILGRPVRTLVDGAAGPGLHWVVWDGLTGDGGPAATGIYFYRLTGSGAAITRKMVLLR